MKPRMDSRKPIRIRDQGCIGIYSQASDSLTPGPCRDVTFPY